MMLFRQLQPELYAHFLEEDIDMQEWTSSWFNYMLAKELPLECLLRLWDTYLAMDEDFCLHPYVCLSKLSQNEF